LSARITLRTAKRGDLSLIEPWYGEAALAVDGGVVPADDPELQGRYEAGGLLVIARIDDPAPIGLLDHRAGWPVRGWVTVEWLALAARQRGWGYGSEAMRQFEERHRGSRFLAQVDPRNGLGLYFWLRMGYRPARVDEVFWRAPDEGGIIAMIRLPGEKE
jgi:GNAT superfamily N-acetyltransferase